MLLFPETLEIQFQVYFDLGIVILRFERSRQNHGVSGDIPREGSSR